MKHASNAYISDNITNNLIIPVIIQYILIYLFDRSKL
jgi:hypothetical protein